ncbi:MAG: sodium:solute symporter, partial [Alphaproteobacteria bacterium]|nr:sodium:solute symporter [Alphaproteobacteria bacterium]
LYTYSSGLRAPAMIAFVKDIMIYIVVFAAIALIPLKLGGYGHVFELAGAALAAKNDSAKGLILSGKQILPFATLALGSAMAAFMYPHTTTGVMSSASRDVVRKNAIFLPAYTILLGLIAMLGFMGLAVGISVKSPNQIVPSLFENIFPEWFVGFSFAAIAIGALVPASIMSIGAANLFTRNVWKAFINPNMSHEAESRSAKLMSLIVKVGALAFIIFLPTQFSINLQLLGGVWILQTFPAIALGLYRTKLHPQALLLGWAAGMGVGSWMAFSIGIKPVYPVVIGGDTYAIYIGLIALVLNLIVSLAANGLLKLRKDYAIMDQTNATDYEAKDA